MAYGYEKGFVVEYDQTRRTRMNCKDCSAYDRNDKSCRRRGLYLPVDGYDSWKRCRSFSLSSDVAHFKEKNQQFKNWSYRQQNQNKPSKNDVSVDKSNRSSGIEKMPFPKECRFGKASEYIAGTVIFHRISGKGIIKSVSDDRIYVQFKERAVTLSLSSCLQNKNIAIYSVKLPNSRTPLLNKEKSQPTNSKMQSKNQSLKPVHLVCESDCHRFSLFILNHGASKLSKEIKQNHGFLRTHNANGKEIKIPIWVDDYKKVVYMQQNVHTANIKKLFSIWNED